MSASVRIPDSGQTSLQVGKVPLLTHASQQNRGGLGLHSWARNVAGTMRGHFLWQLGKRRINFREQRRCLEGFGNFACLLKMRPSFFTPFLYLAGKSNAKANAGGQRGRFTDLLASRRLREQPQGHLSRKGQSPNEEDKILQ